MILVPHPGSALASCFHTDDPGDPFWSRCGLPMGSLEQVPAIRFRGHTLTTFVGVWRMLACSRCYYLVHEGPPEVHESGKTWSEVEALRAGLAR